MFQVDSSRTFLSVNPESIIALYHSVNQVQVLIPGMPAALARAVVVGYRRDSSVFTVEVGLHLPDNQRNVVYSSVANGSDSGSGLEAAEARSAAEEAIAFLESMGFFLEKIGWKELDAVARMETLGRLKVFQPPPEGGVETTTAKIVDPRTVLARVLAQI